MATDALTELQRLAARATPSPWKAGHRTVTAPETDERLPLDVRLYGGNSDDHKRNAKYIAAMHPATAKKLIAVARAWENLRARVETYEVESAKSHRLAEMDQAMQAALDELK